MEESIYSPLISDIAIPDLVSVHGEKARVGVITSLIEKAMSDSVRGSSVGKVIRYISLYI